MATSVALDPAVPAASQRLEQLTETPADETEPRVSPDGRFVAFVSTREAPDGEADLWLLELTGRVAIGDGRARAAGADTAGARARQPRGRRPGRRTARGRLRRQRRRRRLDPCRRHRPAGRRGDRRGAADRGRAAAPGGRVAARRAGRVVAGRAHAARHRSRRSRRRLQRAAASRRGRRRRRRSRRPMDRGARFIPAPPPPDTVVRPLRAAAAASPARRRSRSSTACGTRSRGATTPRNRRRRRGVRCAIATGRGRRPRPTTPRSRTPSTRWSPSSRWCGAPVESRGRPRRVGASARLRGGRRACSRAGGNAIDAAIAASFTLGVVEPDASGIGGDGMALVWRAGAEAPIVVDFKDQAPAAASLDNPAVYRDGRLPDHGPAALNIPGVVAGLDHLHRRFGSGRVAWADLVAPAIRHADEGFVLDGALPATRGRRRTRCVARYEATRAIFLPGGRLPRAGDRFVNRDYAATLRAIAARGRRRVLPRSTCPADGRRHGQPRRHPQRARTSSSTAPLEREPVRGPLPRSRRVLDAAAGRVGHGAVELLQTLDRQPLAPGTRIAARRRRGAPADRDLRQAHHGRAPPIRRSGPTRAPSHLDRRARRRGLRAASTRHAPPRAAPRRTIPRMTAPPEPPERRGRRGRRRRRRARAASRPRHVGARRRRSRRQRRRRHPDAEHVGRQLLRVAGPRLPLQQPPAHGAGAARGGGAAHAARAIVLGQRVRRSSAARSTAASCRGWPRGPPGAPGSSRRWSSSSRRSSTAAWRLRRRSRRRGSGSTTPADVHMEDRFPRALVARAGPPRPHPDPHRRQGRAPLRLRLRDRRRARARAACPPAPTPAAPTPPSPSPDPARDVPRASPESARGTSRARSEHVPSRLGYFPSMSRASPEHVPSRLRVLPEHVPSTSRVRPGTSRVRPELGFS